MLRTAIDRVVLHCACLFQAGPKLHRRGLAASAAGRPEEAEDLFEAAAAAYRRELRVEALARLRVHQQLVRARASAVPGEEAERMLEIVRALNRLDRLESLRAPFALGDARAVLSEWLADGLASGEATLERAA